MSDIVLESKRKRSSPAIFTLFYLVVLAGGATILVYSFGGFPPSSWLLFVHTIPYIPNLWSTHGTQIMLPFTILTLQSLLLFVAWGSLLWLGFRLILSLVEPKQQPVLTPLPLPANPVPFKEVDFTEAQPILPTPAYAKPRIDSLIASKEGRRTSGPLLTIPLEIEESMVDEDIFSDSRVSTPARLKIISGVRSLAGRAKQQQLNGDRVFAQNWQRIRSGITENCGLFLIVDGKSKAMRGQEASRLFIQHIVDACLPYHLAELDDVQLVQQLINGIEESNLATYYHNTHARDSLTAAMVCVLILGATAYVVQIGNCRAYLYSRQSRSLRSIYTSASQSTSMKAQISSLTDNDQFVTLLGETPTISVGDLPVLLSADHSLLLCSDGLWDLVPDQDIEHALHQEQEPAQTANMLIERAQHNGGYDNISAIVIRLEKETSL